MAPNKILVIKIRALGDTVLMTAPLLELLHAFPQSEIHVLVSNTWAPLLEGFPGVQKVWTYQRHKEPMARTRAIARLGYQLFREKFDWVINLHASPSSSLLAFATRAETRAIHFHGHHHKNRYSTVTIPGKGVLKPIIERDMDTVRALGLHIPAGRSPRIYLQDSEINHARNILNKLNLKQPILGLSLGASRPTKSWPIDRFAGLAIEWCKKENGSAIALSGPNESELIRQFMIAVDDLLSATVSNSKERAAIRSQIVAINDRSLKELAGILSQISVLAGNDSGPKHLAIAVGAPTVTLFGPEHPFEWHPYPPDEHPYFFIDQLPCRKDADPGMPPWCGLNLCTIEEHKCMKLIGIDPVLDACVKVKKVK